jgi:two-component system, LytTR family, sensor kinase
MKFSFFSGKRLVTFLHIAAWTVLFFIPVYLFSFDTERDSFFIVRVYIRTIIFILIFYLNFFLLIPRLLFKGKPLYYYICAALLIISLYAVDSAINQNLFFSQQYQTEKDAITKMQKEFKFMPKHPHRFDIYNFLFTSVLITGFSLGLRMAGRYNENEKQRKEMEKEMLNSELAFLKSQVSPHFFFNTLNNIYSLIEINTADAQKAVLQLSKMMRYLLYETTQETVLLSKEIEFMKNYIELMKLRLSNKVDLRVQLPTEYADCSIPPLLFIPFIENAFKHGISYRDTSFIYITMQVTASEIEFDCANSLVNPTEKSLEAKPGIGLENVKKRLTLLFPEEHQLQINQTETIFEVKLKVNMETKA